MNRWPAQKKPSSDVQHPTIAAQIGNVFSRSLLLPLLAFSMYPKLLLRPQHDIQCHDFEFYFNVGDNVDD